MGGIVRPFFSGPAKHLRRLACDPDYRAWRELEGRLGRVPRRSPRFLRACGLRLEVPDAASFLGAFREIFVERSLAFPSWDRAPRILDLGANIGLSVLYFLRDHPDAQITALEPDPALFRVLERNIRGNGGAAVRLLECAAWSQNGVLRFRSDGADGGRVSAADGETPAEGDVEVHAKDAAALFDEGPYDVVKMDIEGAERMVLTALGDRLRAVRYLFVEYHAGPGARGSLASLIGQMEGAGLEVHVHTVRCRAHPFLNEPDAGPYDLLLHLYGVRR